MTPLLVLLLVSALGAAQNLPVTPPNDGRPTNSFLVQGVPYNVTYLLNASIVDVAIVVQTNGWAAFGVRNPTSGISMDRADIIMFHENPPGTFIAQDKWATSEEAPTSDTEQGGVFSLIEWGCTRSGGLLRARFTRLPITGDKVDQPFTADSQTVMLALNANTNDITQQHTNRLAVVLNSGLAAPTNTPALFAAHGIMMFLAFPCAILWSSMFARYAKSAGAWWFPAHWITQGFGTLLAVAALICMLVQLAANGSTSHFTSAFPTSGAHQVLGVTILSMLALQIVLGLIAHFTWLGEGTPTRVWPDMVHHWFGRLLLLAAVVNVFLGIWAINYGGVLLYVLFAIYVGLLLVLIIVAEIYKSKKEK